MPGPDDLFEIEAIKQLKARYFRNLDTRDWEGLQAVFADDASLTVDNSVSDTDRVAPLKLFGAKAIIADLKIKLHGTVSVHHGHMPEITLTSPTTARGIWAMTDNLKRGKDGRLFGMGHYHETYVKSANGWQIQTLHLTRMWLEISGDFYPGSQ
jgi:hypothetical protein